MTFENIVTKEEIYQNEQFLLLPQCFQLFLIINLSFMEIFHVFLNMFQMLAAADLLYVGKGLMFSLMFEVLMNYG